MTDRIKDENSEYSISPKKFIIHKNIKRPTRLELKILKFCIECQFAEESRIRDYLCSVTSLAKNLGLNHRQQLNNYINKFEQNGIIRRSKEGRRRKIIVTERGVVIYADNITRDIPVEIRAAMKNYCIQHLTKGEFEEDVDSQGLPLYTIQNMFIKFTHSEIRSTIIPPESFERLPEYIRGQLVNTRIS